MTHWSGRLIWSAHAADVEANVLGYGVMLVDFDGFSDASWVSSVDRNDEFSFLPVDDVILAV